MAAKKKQAGEPVMRRSASRTVDEAALEPFRQQLERAKRQSMVQVLFKVARLLDEAAVARVAEQEKGAALRRSHMSLFPHIALEGGTRVTELSDKLGISKQAVSKLVDDLVELDVLTRAPDPDDARAARVMFTRRGREGFFRGLAVLRELEDELAGWLGDKRMEQLRSALLIVHDRLTE